MGTASSKISQDGGFRVYSITPGSPAAAAGLEVFFDFIIDVGGIPILSETPSFASLVKDHENEEVSLDVFNLCTRDTRTVSIKPRLWGGPGLVGVVGRFEEIVADSTETIRVIDVTKPSPAEFAGLVSGTDFIIASPESLIRSLEDFQKVIDTHHDQDLRLLVYNSISEQTRGVVIHPDTNGSIGCSVGTGVLHRIPPARSHSDSPEHVPPLLDSRSLSTDPPQLVPFSE